MLGRLKRIGLDMFYGAGECALKECSPFMLLNFFISYSSLLNEAHIENSEICYTLNPQLFLNCVYAYFMLDRAFNRVQETEDEILLTKRRIQLLSKPNPLQERLQEIKYDENNLPDWTMDSITHDLCLNPLLTVTKSGFTQSFSTDTYRMIMEGNKCSINREPIQRYVFDHPLKAAIEDWILRNEGKNIATYDEKNNEIVLDEKPQLNEFEMRLIKSGYQGKIPQWAKDHITKRIMRNPVIGIKTGSVYDEETYKKNRIKIPEKCVPHYALKKAIEDWIVYIEQYMSKRREQKPFAAASSPLIALNTFRPQPSNDANDEIAKSHPNKETNTVAQRL